MTFLDTIAAKRDGRANTKEQFDALARGAADGSIPDYQLSAWLMAACLNGLNPQETTDLTLAMADSGERLDLTGLPKPWLDKHSTGGVGDKTTLVVLPILAACGVTMVKMSGRGLGITGGTIDKLESIPGFRTDLSPEEMIDQARRIGIALSGQTPRLAPADGVLYGLRDVTGTVASIPLITASILSKKIAGGADTVVLDVKCGSGAFMKTLPEAENLARSLVDTGKLCGLKVSAVITDMNQPLGMSVGNALEVKEALLVLHPNVVKKGEPGQDGLSRFGQLCLELAGHALGAVGRGDRATAEACVKSGAALAKAMEWMRAQGATADLSKDDSWQNPRFSAVTKHEGRVGWLKSVDTKAVGEALLTLGGGRRTKADKIDPTAGITVFFAVGQRVCHGNPVFGAMSDSEEACVHVCQQLQVAYEVSPDPVSPVTPVLKVVD